jgi:hypothetical protein
MSAEYFVLLDGILREEFSNEEVDIIVGYFFNQHSVKQLSQSLQMSEPGLMRQLEHVVIKLQRRFARHGYDLSIETLKGLLKNYNSMKAPQGIAERVRVAALSGATQKAKQ